jgi:hypothetical protein
VRFNRAHLERLSARLLAIETLEGDEVRELLRGASVPEPMRAPAPHGTSQPHDHPLL